MHEGDTHDLLDECDGEGRPAPKRKETRPSHAGGHHRRNAQQHDHDHDHGHDHDHDDAPPSARSARALSFLTEDLGAYALPGVILLTLLLSWQGGLSRLLGFDVALVGAALSGLIIIRDTVKVTWQKRRITSGVLVSVALVATVILEDFMAAGIVGFMMLIGEALENRTLKRTRKAIQGLLELAPETALVRVGSDYREVPLKTLKVGDIVLVKPGARVPVDGKVVSGMASLDQASITGESMPVDKAVGDIVFTGTTSVDGAIEVSAERVGDSTSLAQIIRIVRQAQENKGEGQKVADRFAGWFTPAVLVVAGVVWAMTGDVVRSVSILVVACPCALVLATPTVVVAAIGSAARQGVLVKGGITIEEAGRATALVLDKTGTLTLGKPRVEDVIALDGYTEQDVLSAAAVAESRSEHPVARAVLAHTRLHNIAASLPDSFEQVPGLGVRATQAGQSIVVGNRRALAEATDAKRADAAAKWLDASEEQGFTSLVVLRNGVPIGCLAVGDTIREEAAAFVQAMKRIGMKRVVMLTGDNARTARTVAARLGVDDFKAEVLPADKASVVTELRQAGYRVAMIGDGVNDAPALATADVSIAMGVAGTDVAIEAADIALMSDNLAAVPGVFRLSRKAYRIIRQNIIVFGLVINVIGMALAGQGYLTPIASAVVHNVASVLVVVNAARLINFKITD